MERVALALAAVLAVAALVAGPARAATVSADGGTVTVAAAPGERNQIEVWYLNQRADDGVIQVLDGHTLATQRPITAGPGCLQRSPTQVQCDTGVPAPGFRVSLGDGDDDLAYRKFGARSFSAWVVDGGTGNDVIPLFDAPSRVTGGAGNDRMGGASRGGSSRNDVWDGGPGNDILRSDTGVDRLIGGAGADELAVRTDATTRGSTFLGGPGPDKIVTGSARAALIRAGSGDDRILGGGTIIPGGRFVQQPSRSSRPIDCGPGRDRVRTVRAQPRTGCEGTLT
jgi:RTX calcium-binding nonapeptide repeat (4 copies)